MNRIDAFLGDRERVAEYIRNQPDSGYMEAADALCENTFLFNQPWDMEKCTEKISFPDKIDWSYVHNHDCEWLWMLNRHSSWICLMQAYTATGDEKYINTFFDQLGQWLDSESDPAGKEETTWRTLEVGLRLKNWIKILEYIIDDDRFDDELLEKMVDSIHRQIEYLINSYTWEDSLSNWKILEFHGALVASVCFPEFPESGEWIRKCIEILDECIQLQVTPEGLHWEQSFMYHGELLLCMKDVILVCRRNQIPLPDTMIETTKRMVDAVAHLITPAGTQPCYGDSDIEDLRGIMAGFGVLFQNKEYSFLGRGCKPVGIVCDFGAEVLDDNSWETCSRPSFLDYAHEDSGNYFLRSGWDDEAGYLFFKNGFLGSGHGHCDLLHIELFSKGNPVLVDSGRYTYREDTPDRQRFKAAAAHNTLLVDGEEFIIQDGSWQNTKTATAIKRPAVINQEVCYLQGAHMGYLDKGVLVNRKIIYIKPEIWVIVDECFANESHVYEQYFHFAADSLEIRGQDILYTDDKQVFQMSVMQDSRIRKETIEISPAYNSKYTSAGAVVETKSSGTASMTTVCMPESPESHRTVSRMKVYDMNHREVSEDFVTCIRISAEAEEWIVFTNHKEEDERRRVYIIDDILIYARTAVFHRKNGTVKKYILEY